MAETIFTKRDESITDAELFRSASQLLTPGSPWRPIETAPKEEDAPLLLLLENGVPVVASWVPADSEGNIYEGGWWDLWMDYGSYGLPTRVVPTHWMPIPPPPKG